MSKLPTQAQLERLRRFPRSTQRLREIRDAGLREIPKYRDERYFIIISATIHFFEDCMIVQGEYEAGKRVIKETEFYRRIFSVYSKDYGKTWSHYHDQFEPKEGQHRAIKYAPHDSPFPTSEW